MSAVKFFLFGKFFFEIDGKFIHKIEARKAEELLCFLLLNRDQPHSRQFWLICFGRKFLRIAP